MRTNATLRLFFAKWFADRSAAIALAGLFLAGASFPASFVHAQSNQPPASNGTPHQDQKQIEVLAVVNNEEISRQQVGQNCMRRFGKEVLQEIINKFLVTKELERNNLTITEKDINDEIVAEANKTGHSAEKWLELISSHRNLTVNQIKNDYVWNKLALKTLVANKIQVSDEELAQQMEFEFGEKRQVRQIVVDSKEKASQVLEALKSNPADFERIAKKHSIDTNSASMGGLLPPVRKNSGFPEFEQLAFSLEPDQISQPLQVAENFIILRCERILPADQVPPDQIPAIQERLTAELINQKMGNAALALFEQMQTTAQITNVMNDPQLREQHPGIAAIVNGTEIPIRHVAEVCIARFGNDVLKTEINRTLLRAALRDNGMEVTKQDIDEEIQRAALAMRYVDKEGKVQVDQWLNYITDNDLSKVEFYVEDEVWPSIALKKLVAKGVSISEEDMQKGFEANFGPRVEVLAIMSDNHQQLTEVWKMASQNPTAEFFGKLANQYSIEPASRNNFGQVPPIQKHGGRPELEKEAFSLKPGELSKVVQVGDFWIIMFCQGMTEPVVTDFDAVKDEIYQNILEKKTRIAMAERFQTLIEEAQIDNFLAGTSQTGKKVVRQARANSENPSPRNPVR